LIEVIHFTLFDREKRDKEKVENFPISRSHEIVKNMTIIFFKRLYKVMYYVNVKT